MAKSKEQYKIWRIVFVNMRETHFQHSQPSTKNCIITSPANLTSDFIPSASEAAAATIKITKVRSLQASHINIYKNHRKKKVTIVSQSQRRRNLSTPKSSSISLL